jgi:hypothetical protein
MRPPDAGWPGLLVARAREARRKRTFPSVILSEGASRRRRTSNYFASPPSSLACRRIRSFPRSQTPFGNIPVPMKFHFVFPVTAIPARCAVFCSGVYDRRTYFSITRAENFTNPPETSKAMPVPLFFDVIQVNESTRTVECTHSLLTSQPKNCLRLIHWLKTIHPNGRDVSSNGKIRGIWCRYLLSDLSSKGKIILPPHIYSAFVMSSRT